MSPERRSEARTPRRDASQPRPERWPQIWRVFEYRRPAPIVRPRFTT
jgi:hypothetical protein